ncbi:LysR family transcriptional regulator [Photobacterium jeanii]|uniref:LysR family transcriptional regulator n=1 Tax=Photobacterium jeanii TaxID=858640 RepID=A0A178K8S8_9GAMM|nr:LysR family transcriptional regulator [Photobacterium jeanii]OAN13092.1 LysR family transcriptional regulator [Photobacterium jeanii]PST89242.1 LysR family transcriptional regulator [Photobacterium jeanii]
MAFNPHLLDGMLIFVEVVNSGSFTKAAENSGHSTSYISKEINKLEERLGVRLLHRTTRSLSLTPEGDVYFQQCQQLILDAEQAEQAITGGLVEPRGLLRISCPINLGVSKIRPILAKYMEKYPEVKLELDLNDRRVDMVAEGFDLLIRASSVMDDSSLICRPIFHSEAVTLASPAYLSQHGTPQHPSELVDHDCICYSNLKTPNQWLFHDKQGGELCVEVDSKVLTNSSEMELALCIAGKGITRLPRFNLRNEINEGLLVPLFPDFNNPSIVVYMMYPSRKHMSSKVRSFIDFILDELGEYK